jgi:ribonuclease HII
MGILIGMDEAGYGPNLGPLVVAATAWEVADGELASASGGARNHNADRSAMVSEANRGHSGSDRRCATVPATRLATAGVDQFSLYRRLRRIVARSPSDTHIAIADSKTLYKPGHGLRQLERGVHAALAAIGCPVRCWSDLVRWCDADPEGLHLQLCWHEGFNCRLPMDSAVDELAPLGERLATACDGAGVRPLAVRARMVFPAEFNELCDQFASKGAALSHITIGLLREVIDATRTGVRPLAEASSPVFVLCDKHGARNFYTGLLQHHFSEHWIEPIVESHAESSYEWGPPESRVHCRFRMQGEAFLPTALASMTAKYLRELSMRAFNEFWCARVSGLRPTAGYPADAPRFKREIEAMQRALGIDDHVLWRNR